MSFPAGWNPADRQLAKPRVLSSREFKEHAIERDRPPKDKSDLSGFRPYRVSSVGQVTLPAAVRRNWGIDGGGRVEMANFGDVVLVLPAGAAAEFLIGMLPGALESDARSAEAIGQQLVEG